MIRKKISKILALATILCSAVIIAPHNVNANATQIKAERSMSSVGKVTAVSGLNIRKSATTNSQILGAVPYSGQVNIKSKSGDWYYIEYNGTYGYVSDSYINVISGNSSNNNSSSSVSGTGKVTARSGLNLRKSASTSAGIITTISYNSQVTIKSKNGNWYYVDYKGSLGYVSSDYVERTQGNNSTSNNQVVSQYDKILSAMKSQIGKPYVYGGSSPSTGFDCSGLMQWGFNQGGINIGRTTYDQVNAGYGVSVNSAKPGDLLVYSNKGHIGMYIGNGQWIESPSTGKTVRISNVPWDKIGYARRVIK